MNSILEGLNESRINEASKVHVVRYTANDLKDAQLICSTKEYNKVKKTPGYKELDHSEFSSNDSIKYLHNSIRDYIEKYGLKKYGSLDDGGTVLGTYGELGYGYILYKDAKQKPYGFGFEK